MIGNKAAHLITGKRAEQRAVRFLTAQGLKTIGRNYRCRAGEIDLIMQHGNILVFVEVRYRKSNKYGSALESVTAAKQSRIITTASHYLTANKINQPVRFDVIAITGNDTLDWIQNAFQT